MIPLTAPTGRLQTLTAAFLALAMAVVVGTALGFQHLGGYIPCKLCLEQRLPYYVGVPLMALAALSSVLGLPGVVTRGLLLAGGLLMAYGVALGTYHAGVEWAWWQGPTDCGAVEPATPAAACSTPSTTIVPPSCDKAALRVLGLSFAGWNVIASLVLALVAFRGALARP